MKRDKNRQIPQHDYGQALQGAVSWLGERYVLAEPVQKRVKQFVPLFNEPRGWHPSAQGS